MNVRTEPMRSAIDFVPPADDGRGSRVDSEVDNPGVSARADRGLGAADFRGFCEPGQRQSEGSLEEKSEGHTVLAIDPGPEQSGWCLYRRDGVVLGSGVKPNDIMIQEVRYAYAESLAIEMIASYGMAVGREVFETCVWIGRFQQAFRSPSEVKKVYRKDVKLHLCGTTKAKDANIRQALIDIFGGSKAIGKKACPGPLYGVKSHAWPALAVAVTVMATP